MRMPLVNVRVSVFKWFAIVSRLPAYELQTNRTTYDTVFNSRAVQMIEFEPRVWPRTFTRIITQKIVNLSVLAEKLHYVTFGVITRTITRLSKIHVSR